MHDTAYAVGRAFFESYVGAGDRILEVGAYNVNGSLRDFCPAGSHYVGIDLTPGPSVDVVAGGASRLPFAAETFDVVVSSSCFEHDSMFWVTFLELCRVVKDGGYIYLNAPSKGEYHRYPIDCWRFFPDAGMALSAWARTSGYDVTLIESFIAGNLAFRWGDCVMIFGRRAYPAATLVAERCPDAVNVRTWPDLAALDREAESWPG
jgi:SAM-dependent methyltransferase